MTNTVLPWVAFAEGLASFLSPCVLPMVPGYLAFLAGDSYEVSSRRGRLMRRGVLFSLGFSTVFILLGAAAGLFGRSLLAQQHQISPFFGIILVLFGLHSTGLVPIRILYRESRLLDKLDMARDPAAFLVGAAFALGWTPCVGPALASIFALAMHSETVWAGVGLFVAYSVGLAIPFLLAALFFDQLRLRLLVIRRYLPAIAFLGGLMMIFLGVLMLTGTTQIAGIRFF